MAETTWPKPGQWDKVPVAFCNYVT